MESTYRTRNLLIAGLAALTIFACIGSVTVAGAIGYFFITEPDGNAQSVQIRIDPTPAQTPTPSEPTSSGQVQDTPEAGSTTTPRLQISDYLTEQQLADVIVPTRDLRDLAIRLRPGVTDVPRVVNEQTPNYTVGDELEFWVSNVDENRHFQVEARLIHRTENAYAWVEVGQSHDEGRIAQSVTTFSDEIYPVVREFFGSEWKPGVDNDPRLHILHASNLGNSIAGYYSSADEFSSLANEFSNEKEMFYISLDWLNRSQNYEYYETVLAHEFQHMIHWHNDRNEETWANEGLSELAQEVAGYAPDTGFANVYADIPDTQLNTWSDDPAGNGKHYGSAYLFMAYMLQRFGDEVTKAIVSHEANGITGITQALQESTLGDPRAEQPELTFYDAFADWIIANYIDRPDALDRQNVYGYEQLAAPQPVLDVAHRQYPVETRSTDVRNFGVDYIGLQDEGDITIYFEGDVETELADVQAYSGDFMWWSNRADDSNSRLTRRFDFQDIGSEETIHMHVNMWYDIEDDYDYGYVLASQDGVKWDILPGQSTTTTNPSGNSFGAAYTSESSSEGEEPVTWITETFDLSAYAGEEVFVRFEYVTDDAVNYPGWFVDDISIPAIGYETTFEAGTDGWESEGWLLTDNRLSQRWLLQLLILEGDRLVDLRRIPVGSDGTATIEVDGTGGRIQALLTVSGLSLFTTEPAEYQYRVEVR